MKFNNVITIVDDASSVFEKNVNLAEKVIYDEAMKIVKSLDTDARGNIKPSIDNLKKLASVKKRLARITTNKKYLKAVEEFVNSYDELYKKQLQYFASFVPNASNYKSKYNAMKRIAIDNTISTLTGAGVQAVVTDKLNDILLRAVTSKAKFSDLTRELHEHLTTTENKQGALSKYANTYATTSMSQYVGENNRLLTNDLGLEWFEYVGSNIETTREFCDHLTEKRYIHKSEIKTILKGEIDGHQCEMNERTGLPKGMIEGTNEHNFQVNCGGWNCRHQLVPVAKEAVPLDIRRSLKRI